MPDREFEELKFHWDKWKEESQAFWGRAILGTGIILLSILFQFGIISISMSWVHLTPPRDPWWFYFFVNLFSWYLLGFLSFKFIDLMRHRVPERFEPKVHNNFLPLGPVLFPLKVFGRILYLIFPLYALTVAIVLAIATISLFSGTLPSLHQDRSITPNEKAPGGGLLP
jgi:hypothetical protein